MSPLPRLPRLPGLAIAIAALALPSCAGLRPTAGDARDPEYLRLVTGQPASFVIGQPSLEAEEIGWTRFLRPWGNASILGGRLFISDTAGNRIWGFDRVPQANVATPDFVLGEASPSEVAEAPFAWPQSIQEYRGRYYVSDIKQGVISIWKELPTGRRSYADATLITGFKGAQGLTIADGKMVTSSDETMVRIWRKVPAGGTSDDGSPVILSRAGGVPFSAPRKHWTDGKKLLVADSENHRVLGWNTLPERNDQEPDFVLGQKTPDCGGCCEPGTTRETMRSPHAVASNGTQIFVRDTENCRVLVWNSFPARNGAPADVVLGQADFESGQCNRGQEHTGADRLCEGYGIFYGDHKLFVADWSANGAVRWLVYESR